MYENKKLITAEEAIKQLGNACQALLEIIQDNATEIEIPENILNGIEDVTVAREKLGLGTVATENTVPVSKGGTGKSSLTSYQPLIGGTSTTGAIQQMTSTSTGAMYRTSTIAVPTWGTLPIAQGGTGKTTWTSGGVLYASAANTLSQVTNAAGALYKTSSTGTPTFGTLPIEQGGTGASNTNDALKTLGAAAASDITKEALVETIGMFEPATATTDGKAGLIPAPNTIAEAIEPGTKIWFGTASIQNLKITVSLANPEGFELKDWTIVIAFFDKGLQSLLSYTVDVENTGSYAMATSSHPTKAGNMFYAVCGNNSLYPICYLSGKWYPLGALEYVYGASLGDL